MTPARTCNTSPLHQGGAPVALGLALLLAGCPIWEFQGEDKQIGFTSNLTSGAATWTPETRVAVGARLHVQAVEFAGLDAGQQVLPQVFPNGILGDVVQDAGYVEATATAPGRARVEWSGAAQDHFSVGAEEVSRAQVKDPALLLARAMLDGENASHRFLVGGFWEDVGTPIRLTQGAAPLWLQVFLQDQDGGALAAHSGFVEASNASLSNSVAASIQGGGLQLEAALDGGLEPEPIQLQRDGGILGTASVQPTRLRDVVQVSLAVAIPTSPGARIAAKATALDRDGGAIWQAPFVWQHAHFTAAGLPAFLASRTDVRLLDAVLDAGPGQHTFPVQVELDGLSQTVLVPITIQDTSAPDAGPGSAQPTCGCHASSATGGGQESSQAMFPVAVVVLLLWRQSRPRRAQDGRRPLNG